MAELRFEEYSGIWPVTDTIIMQPSLRWYAAYTAPRHEKSALQHLESRSVESFLPLYGSARMWNGRRAIVQMPLFPGYLFVRISPDQRVRVLEVPGVLNIVSSHGKLIPLPEGEIEALRVALEIRKSEPHPLLTTAGECASRLALCAGLEGIIVRQTRKLRMIVSIDCIMQSFAVELEASDLESPASHRVEPGCINENHTGRLSCVSNAGILRSAGTSLWGVAQPALSLPQRPTSRSHGFADLRD